MGCLTVTGHHPAWQGEIFHIPVASPFGQGIPSLHPGTLGGNSTWQNLYF